MERKLNQVLLIRSKIEVRKINIKCFSKINEISDNALKKCLTDIKEFLPYFSVNKNEEQ